MTNTGATKAEKIKYLPDHRGLIKRTHTIKIRVSDEEKEKLNQLKTESQLAVWMRKTCLAEKVNSRTDVPKCDPKLLYEVAKIGNNINQIARNINTSIKSEERINSLEIMIHLREINEYMQSLINDK